MKQQRLTVAFIDRQTGEVHTSKGSTALAVVLGNKFEGNKGEAKIMVQGNDSADLLSGLCGLLETVVAAVVTKDENVSLKKVHTSLNAAIMEGIKQGTKARAVAEGQDPSFIDDLEGIAKSLAKAITEGKALQESEGLEGLAKVLANSLMEGLK